MHNLLDRLAVVAACALALVSVAALNAKDTPESTSHPTKPAPTRELPPLPALTTFGRGVFIRPLAELSLAGQGNFEVLPRISHINITVDGTARHEMVILFNLPPGPHKVLLELADSTEKVVTSETVEFTLPDRKQP